MLRLLTPSSSTIKAIGGFTSQAQHRAPQYQILTRQRRCLANIKVPRPESIKSNIKDPKPPVFPGGSSNAAPEALPPAGAASPVSPPPNISTSPATPSSSSPTAPTQVPLTPPLPAATSATKSPKVIEKIATSTPTSTSTSPPSSPPSASFSTPKKTHRLRNFLLGLTFVTGTSFASGVFYSLKSDNVHDFFTEYIPLGEETVLYFEEREFRRRFPNALSRIQSKTGSPKVTIPKSAGATWRLANDEKEEPRTTDVGKDGPHISTKKSEEERIAREKALENSSKAVHAQGASTEAEVVDRKPAPASKGVEKIEAIEKLGLQKPSTKQTTTVLSAVSLPEAHDRTVQDLVKAVNDIINAVNASGSAGNYSSLIDATKAELTKLNNQVMALKTGVEKATQEKLAEKDLEFTKAAQGLLTNVNNEIVDMEHKWRDEFEAEREKISQGYREKLYTELEKSRLISEQRLRNELMEQAIEMKRKWINEIEERVENERGGRLGKLQQLSDAVSELEKLTVSWNDVVDQTLKTQQIFTALEAVKASYESPDQPKPFLREIAALKEVSNDDEIIRAAIASINPAAYQNGVSTHPQLIDRFRKVATEARKAALLPEDAGIAAHAGNWILSKLMFKKSGLAQGDDVESILTRTEVYLEEGNVDNATRELNQLRGWARTLAKDWLREARLLLEVEQALEVIAAEARVQSLRVQEN